MRVVDEDERTVALLEATAEVRTLIEDATRLAEELKVRQERLSELLAPSEAALQGVGTRGQSDERADAFRFSSADPRRYTSIMATTAEQVLKEALQLSEGERARVAAELLASLEPDVETRDGEAWIAEVERRAQAAIGGLPGLSWDETRTRVEERISRTRK